MLLTKEVEVNLHPSNINYFKEKGYILPTRVCDNGKEKVIKGSSIMVKTYDLKPSSKVLVEVQCDYCHKKLFKKFADYNKHRKNIQKDCCGECKHIKQKELFLKDGNYFRDIFRRHGYELEDMSHYEAEVFNHKNFKFKIKCPEGHLWETTINNFRNTKRGCPYCSGYTNKWNYDTIKKYLLDYNCILFNDKNEELNSNSIIRYKCSCGNEYSKYFYSFQDTPSCPECCKMEYYNTTKVSDILSKRGYVLLSEYINSSSYIKVVCDKGHVVDMIAGNLISGKTSCAKCSIEARSGKNHPHWNKNLTQEERLIGRYYKEYKHWRTKVYERDNYICVKCKDKTNNNLVAHHKDGYNWCKERRLDVSNGVTLCKDCHDEFHSKYKCGNNTEEQYEEWIKNK